MAGGGAACPGGGGDDVDCRSGESPNGEFRGEPLRLLGETGGVE